MKTLMSFNEFALTRSEMKEVVGGKYCCTATYSNGYTKQSTISGRTTEPPNPDPNVITSWECNQTEDDKQCTYP